MHLLWQFKQIVTIDGEQDVDCDNCFGGRGSPGIYIPFDGLVTWIAKKVKLIPDLWMYMDDSFGIDEERNMLWYHHYGKNMPTNQVKLLSLWNELGIPHEWSKQIFGNKLTAIGIEVNTNSLTLMLPSQGQQDLLEELCNFTAWSEKKKGTSQTLQRWQQLTGWLNWSFNVFPMIRPALNSLYPKIARKDKPHMTIWVNNAVHEDLTWATSHLCDSLRVRLLSLVSWDAEDADKTIFCDACPTGLAFWFPSRCRGFFSPVPVYTARNIIFYFEALAVAGAFDNLATSAVSSSKIIVHTDSMNIVNIFNSLRCLPEFNPLLQHCVNIVLGNNFDVQVIHVPGVQNVVADAISHREFQKA